MGCDCGCGGTCPVCAGRLGREMSYRASVILDAARILDDNTKLVDTKKQSQKKKKGVKK